jgi:hypothetical protein
LAKTSTAPTPTAEAEPASTAAALRIPAPRRLHYSVSGEARRLQYAALGELLWQHDGSSYSARLALGARGPGTRVQTSAGQLTADGLAPARFGDKARTEVAAHFERAQGKISFSANSPDATLMPGAQDRLSVLLQLGALLAGDPARYPEGSRIALQTVGAREAESWQLEVGADEPLALPGGTLATRKLQRLPVREFDLKVELWLAPALDWLPVQLRITQASGDYVQLVLEKAGVP